MDRRNSEGMIIDADAWLSSIFGYPVYRVSLPSATQPPLAASAEDIFQRTRPAFSYARVPTARVDQVNALTTLGFNVVDVNVTLEHRGVSSATALPEGLQVRDGLASDREELLDIAASSFVYSRFHLDPQIPNALASEVKRAWMDNYCLGKRGDRLLVAVLNARPVGFLAGLRTRVADECAWIIDLVGVRHDYQGRGIGRALVQRFVLDSKQDADVLRVGTQAANVPSISLYEGCGFHVTATAYVLHAHT